jgi:antitoxin HigA-1
MKPERLSPAPISPGDFLRHEIMGTLKITQEELADAMGVSRISINQIVNGRRSVTADMALRIGRVTGTTLDLWLNLQHDVDLYEARRKLAGTLPKLKVLHRPKSLKELLR